MWLSPQRSSVMHSTRPVSRLIAPDTYDEITMCAPWTANVLESFSLCVYIIFYYTETLPLVANNFNKKR